MSKRITVKLTATFEVSETAYKGMSNDEIREYELKHYHEWLFDSTNQEEVTVVDI